MDGNDALAMSYHKSLLDKHRVENYNMSLRFNLLIKMMEEKGLFAVGEFDRRWPQHLKADIGALGPDGVMEGTLKVTFWNEK